MLINFDFYSFKLNAKPFTFNAASVNAAPFNPGQNAAPMAMA